MKRLVLALALVAGMYGQKLGPGDTGSDFMGRRSMKDILIDPLGERLEHMRKGKLTQDDVDFVLKTGQPQEYVETFKKLPHAAMRVLNSSEHQAGHFRGVLLKDDAGLTFILYEDIGKDNMTAIYYTSDPKMTRDEALVLLLKYLPLHSDRRVR